MPALWVPGLPHTPEVDFFFLLFSLNFRANWIKLASSVFFPSLSPFLKEGTLGVGPLSHLLSLESSLRGSGLLGLLNVAFALEPLVFSSHKNPYELV